MAETLNLVDKSDRLSCSYEIDRFPDGQQSIRIIERIGGTFWSLAEQKSAITIKSRLNSFKDLELIICANQALKEIGVKKVNLYIPYFLGARSDRKFQKGGIHYIKSVIAPIINSQGFSEVIVLDPHSDVLEACIEHFRKVDNQKLVDFAIDDIGEKETIILVSPDAGAYKKIFDVAQKSGIEKIITATKVRDIKTGKIIQTEIFLKHPGEIKKYLIIDDIGDGFGTFIELSKTIRQIEPYSEVYLAVTHSIQSEGLDRALKHFDKIYTTNSVSDWQKERLKTINIF